MINGFTILSILLFMPLIKMLVGIFNGIGMKLANLPFMEKGNIMVGTQTKPTTL